MYKVSVALNRIYGQVNVTGTVNGVYNPDYALG
jgi:hypothetical protein